MVLNPRAETVAQYLSIIVVVDIPIIQVETWKPLLYVLFIIVDLIN